MYLVTSVKTVFNQDIYKPWVESVEDKGKDVADEFPPPITRKIACLGYMVINDQFDIEALNIGREDQETEEEILQVFSGFVKANVANLITWNGKRFDLPVIVYRCLHHRVPLPWYFENSAYRYRFTTDGHFDLADYISDYFSTPKPSLNLIAKLVGLPGKLWNPYHTNKLYNENKMEEISKYCITDVIQIYAVFLRIMHLRGILGDAAYYAAKNRLDTYVKNTAEKQDSAVSTGCTLFLENCKEDTC